MPIHLPALLLRWLLLPFLAVMAAMARVGGPLVNPVAPSGIVSLELCAYRGTCGDILQSWSPRVRESAMLSLGLDYLYMALYPTIIACALLVLARGLPAWVQALARWLAALLLVAGLADAVENACLIHLLRSNVVDDLATVAAVAATVKFGILAVALAALVMAAAWRLLRRRRPAPGR